MFSVRSKSGLIFTSTEWNESNGKEIEYETAEEAAKEIPIYKQSFPDQEFYIHDLNVIGRPSLGITKKVSLTLPENYWEWLDAKAEGNRSKFLREVVTNALGSESEWSNYACLGYAILGAEKLGYTEKQIQELVRSILGTFDFKTVDEAKDAYTNSDY